MKLAQALEEKIMDTRLMDRLLAEGKLTKKQVDDYLSKIEDSSEGSYEKVGSAAPAATETEASTTNQ